MKSIRYTGLSYNMAEEQSEFYQIKAEGFPASHMDDLGMATAYEKNGKPYSSEGISRRLGGILNVNYTFDHRYYIDLSGKLEGSSRFNGSLLSGRQGSVGISTTSILSGTRNRSIVYVYVCPTE